MPTSEGTRSVYISLRTHALVGAGLHKKTPAEHLGTSG